MVEVRNAPPKGGQSGFVGPRPQHFIHLGREHLARGDEGRRGVLPHHVAAGERTHCRPVRDTFANQSLDVGCERTVGVVVVGVVHVLGVVVDVRSHGFKPLCLCFT